MDLCSPYLMYKFYYKINNGYFYFTDTKNGPFAVIRPSADAENPAW